MTSKHFYSTLLIFLFSFNPGLAQDYVLDSIRPLYSFINWEANTIKFADRSPAFQELYKRIHNIAQEQEDKLHIMHIGGSHIQADMYTNKLRSYLQHMSSTAKGQRGLIFPYKMARTNNPTNYKVAFDGEWKGYRSSVTKDSITWGLTGVTAEFKDSIAHISLNANHKNYYENVYEFDRIRIFFNNWEDDYKIVFDPSVSILQETRDYRAFYNEYTLGAPADSISFTVERVKHHPDARFLMMGIELMKDTPGIEYTTIGVNGASFAYYERCAYFETQMMLYQPDLFIISIGTNDTYKTEFDAEAFKAKYKAMIEMVQRANPQVAILLTVPNDSYYKRQYPNPYTKDAREVIYQLAEEYNMAVWDFYEVMGGFGSAKFWYQNELMPKDRIHFTKLGYSIKADLLLEALTASLENALGLEPKSLLNQIIND